MEHQSRSPGYDRRSPGVQMIYVLVISAICLGITAVVTAPLLALFSILAAFASKPDPGKPLKPRIPSGLGRLLLLICIFVTPLVVLMLNPGMSQEQQIDTVIINTQLIILILILTTPIASSAPITQNETQNED
jgi:hypothetical protein